MSRPAAPEEEPESRWQFWHGALGALAELAVVVLLALLYLFKPLIWRGIVMILAFALLVAIVGSPYDPLWDVAVAFLSLVVILFVIRKTMQG